MRRCVYCKKKIYSDTSTFCVPKDIKRKELWTQICRSYLSPTGRICKDHFMSSDIITAGVRRILMPAAFPKIQLPQEFTEEIRYVAHQFIVYTKSIT